MSLVFVVEGRHDEQKLKSIYPDIGCIITNGSEISKETLSLIYQTSLVKEVILFLDPDGQGKKITEKVLSTKGNFKLAYINKSKAINKQGTKIGIEHAKNEDIIKALEHLFVISYENQKITYQDLYERNLIGKDSAKKRREKLSQALQIPLANGKSFLKYLNMLKIELERIDEIIEGQGI